MKKTLLILIITFTLQMDLFSQAANWPGKNDRGNITAGDNSYHYGATNIGPGDFNTFSACEGVEYRFYGCSAGSWDADYVLFTNTGGSLLYNFDGETTCSWRANGTVKADNRYTSSSTLTIRVVMPNYPRTTSNPSNNWNYSGATSSTRLAIKAIKPVTPAAPTGGGTICIGSSSTLTRSGSPAGSGITWYWQTNSGGTSTSIGSGTSLTVSPGSSTTYYVRPKTCNGYWGAASSGVTVTVTAYVATTFDGLADGSTSCGASYIFGNEWYNSLIDDLDWTVDAGGTPSSSTGPSSGAEGTAKYIYVEPTSSCSNPAGQVADMISECLTLGSNPTCNDLKFNYHFYGANNMGHLYVDATTDGISWLTLFTAGSSTLGSQWQSATVDLSAYNNQTIALRFRRVIGNTWSADVAVDQIYISNINSSTYTPVSISPPNNVTLDANTSCQAILADYTGAGVITGCVYTVTQSPAIGSALSLGVNVITLNVVDARGNSSSCTFNVTVIDNELPVITCPGNQVGTADGSCNFTIPDYTSLVTATDNCSVSSVTQEPAAGTIVGIGPTNIVLIVTDVSSNTVYCNFNVVVTDVTTVVTTFGGLSNGSTSCGASYIFGNEWYNSLIDDLDWTVKNGSTPSSSTGPSSGAEGTTKYTYVESSGSCFSPAGKVADMISECLTMGSNTCNDLKFNYHFYGAYNMGYLYVDATSDGTSWNTLFTAGSTDLGNAWQSATVDLSAYNNQTIALRFRRVIGSTYYADVAVDQIYISNVNSSTYTPVSIACPSNVSVNANASCQAVLSDYTGAGVVTGCVYTVTQSPAIGSTLSLGINVITLNVVDARGNSSSCTFNVTVLDNEPPVITCPQNQVGTVNGSCNFTLPDYTGLASAGDNCPGVTVTQVPAPGTIVGLGTTNIVFTATDGASNTANCNFDVVVSDNTNPTITCPGNQTESVDGSCVFTLPDYTGLATAADNCTGVTVAQVPAPGTIVGLGTTNIVFTATDGASNTANCNFDVVVTDNTNPTVTCPGNQTESVDGSCVFTLPDYTGLATAGDNCPGVTVTQVPVPGTNVGVGTTNIVFTATDGSSNTANCNFDVVVTDATNPTITCPGNQIGSVDGSCNFTIPDYTGLVISNDNCNPSPTVTQSPVAGTVFSSTSITMTTITMTSNDGNGNTASCSFDLAWNDGTAPTAVCQNINVYLDGTGNASIVAADLDGGSTDNCGTVTLSASQTSFTCADIGANNVTLTGDDGNGNTSTCVAVVTVTEVSSTTPSSISSSSSFLCTGDSVTLTQVGGSLSAGATYSWYTGSCGGVLIGTGNSITVLATAITTFYVSAESFCNNITSCASFTVIVNGSSVAPNSSVVLALASTSSTNINTSTSTCVVEDDEWHYFYNPEGELISAMNSHNQNLGNVTIMVTVGDDGPFGQGLPPGVCGSIGASGGEYVLPRYWDISVENQPSTGVNVRVYYSATDLSAIIAATGSQNQNYKDCWGEITSESDLMVTLDHGTSLESIVVAPCPPFFGGSSRQIDFVMTEFSNVKLHSNSRLVAGNALPVELIEFTAEARNNETIQLNWRTATEINNRGFEIERSTDGISFEKIDYVDGNGNSNKVLLYSVLDASVEEGIYYYRLKQIDFDDAFEYSKVVSASIKGVDGVVVSYFMPNPAADVAKLNFELTKNTKAQIEVFDNLGRLISTKVFDLSAGKQAVEFNTSDYSVGIYTAKILMDKQEYSRKLVIRK